MIHRTRPAEARVHASGWVAIGDGLEVTAIPLVDERHPLDGGRAMFARLTYADALTVAAREGARLIRPAEVELVRRIGLQLQPYLGTPTAETDLAHSERHDLDVWRQLSLLGWDGTRPVCGAGKHWVDGAPPGRSRLMGWDRDGAGPGLRWWQPDSVAHDRNHHDDGTTTVLVRPAGPGLASRLVRGASSALGWLVSGFRPTLALAEHGEAKRASGPPRPTLALGATGEHVRAWQAIVGATPDGDFGPATDALTRRWQDAHGLVGDGVVGPRSWRAAGETPAEPGNASGADPRAPACVAALRDANLAWPARSRRSDGIMGDASHQARPSDHNLGNAVDITHDPANGCDCNALAACAILDPRVQYVIWNARIWNRDRSAEGWRAYGGSNPHRHHMHISVRAIARGDASRWPWAP